MLKPVSNKTEQHRAYQQALDDFGITELLAKLKNYSGFRHHRITSQAQKLL